MKVSAKTFPNSARTRDLKNQQNVYELCAFVDKRLLRLKETDGVRSHRVRVYGVATTPMFAIVALFVIDGTAQT